MKLVDIRNEQKYNEQLHEGVNAFRKLYNEEVEYLGEGVHGKVEDQELIPTILQLALRRRKFVTYIRDKMSRIDFVGLQQDEAFKALRKEITGEYPQLANISAKDLFVGICNSIAHGQSEGSFDFDGYRKLLKQAYGVSQLKYIKNAWQKKEGVITADKIAELSTIRIKLRYGYFAKKKGELEPLIYDIPINLNKIVKINNLVSKYFKKRNLAITSPKDGEAYEYDLNTKEIINKNLMDNIKSKTYQNIVEDIISFYDSDLINLLSDETEKTLSNFATKTALTKTCLLPSIVNYRLDDLENTVKAISISKANLKACQKDLITNAIKGYTKKDSDKAENVARALYCAKLDNIYQELLTTQLVSLLECFEARDCLDKFANNDIVKSIASAMYEKNEEKVTDRNCSNTIKLMRNALVHMNYLYDPATDEFHYYSLIKNDSEPEDIDKTALEYRVTVDIEEMEKLNEIAYRMYHKILQEEVEALPNSNVTAIKTEPVREETISTMETTSLTTQPQKQKQNQPRKTQFVIKTKRKK